MLADTTVIVAYRESLRDMWEDLSESVSQVFVVGGAMSLRDVVCAMCEGHLSARTIDDPSLASLWSGM